MERKRGGGRGQRGKKPQKSSQEQPQRQTQPQKLKEQEQPERPREREQPQRPREQEQPQRPREQEQPQHRPRKWEQPQKSLPPQQQPAREEPRRDVPLKGEERKKPFQERPFSPPPREEKPTGAIPKTRPQAVARPAHAEQEPAAQGLQKQQLKPGRGRGAPTQGEPERSFQQFPPQPAEPKGKPQRVHAAAPPPGFSTQEPQIKGVQRVMETTRPGRGRGAGRAVSPPGPAKQPVGKEIPPAQEGEALKTGDTAESLAQDIKEKFVIEERATSTELARRPDKGKEGRKFGVFANHFKIQIPGGNIYHYDVTITPKRRAVQEEKAGPKEKKFRPLSLSFNRKLFEEFRATCNEFKSCYPVFDGNKNLFTRRPLGIKSETKFTLIHVEEERDREGNPKTSEFIVAIKPVVKKDKSCAINLDLLHGVLSKTASEINLEAVMAVEVILRYCPSLVFVPVGRSLYRPPGPNEMIKSISNGLQLYFGYHQSVHLGENGIFFNLDRAITAFYPAIPLLDLVQAILDITPEDKSLNGSQIKRLQKELRMLKIKTIHAVKRKYTIKKVHSKSSKDATFKMDDRTISVAEYFSSKYNFRLRYPFFPCIDVGSKEREILLPMEVCQVIENQPHRSKLSGPQTSDVIKLTAVEPNKRFDEICKKRDEVDKICDPVKKEFDIKIDKNPHHLVARQLLSPFIVYYGERKVQVRDGAWDLRNIQLYEAKYSIENWVIISLASDRFCTTQVLERFADKLIEQANNLGITMSRCRQIYIHRTREPADDVASLLQGFKRKDSALQLVVFVLRGNLPPEKDRHLYATIKKAGDSDLALPTQCVKDNNVAKKCSPQLLANILLKINAKMGGVNSTFAKEQQLPILKESAIIIGADVNHPAPGDRVKPSIAAVVGSLDNHPSRYFASVRLQKRQGTLQSRLEIIQELREMVKEVLKEYYKSTKARPKKIIFFRDGVSEGQFQDVVNEEVKQIELACQDLSSKTSVYDPALTFVIIQKRHHTRFVPEDPRMAIRSGNIPPGTTVDTDIVHPLNFDYFQCSHAGIKGTSRPTKYTVLKDENNFKADEIQQLTHYLCHIFMRCTRSISLPAPVQYAHLAAFRAKGHLESLSYDTMSVSSDEYDEDAPISRDMINAVTIDPKFRSSMYFC